MKLFITGISGLLGANIGLQARARFQVSGCYQSHPINLDGVQAIRLDVTSPLALEQALPEIRPDIIIHTAGLTNVEVCEADPALAHRENAEAAYHVATIAHAIGAQLVHISTDHLFDGTTPWKTEADTPAPINVYAQTKRWAEEMVLQACPDALVIRTNFFGWGTRVRRSFSDWIIQTLANGREITGFDDVFFTPICINDLADRIFGLLLKGSSGIFHVAGGERLTKYAFALETAQVFGYATHLIRPISVEKHPFRARRPKDMSLSSRRAEEVLQARMPMAKEGLHRLRALQDSGWQRALDEAIRDTSLSAQPRA